MSSIKNEIPLKIYPSLESQWTSFIHRRSLNGKKTRDDFDDDFRQGTWWLICRRFSLTQLCERIFLTFNSDLYWKRPSAEKVRMNLKRKVFVQVRKCNGLREVEWNRQNSQINRPICYQHVAFDRWLIR